MNHPLPDSLTLEFSARNILDIWIEGSPGGPFKDFTEGAEASVEIPIKNAEPEGNFDKAEVDVEGEGDEGEDVEVIEETTDGHYALKPDISVKEHFLQSNPANCEEAKYNLKIEYYYGEVEGEDVWPTITTRTTDITFDGYSVDYADPDVSRVEIPADGGNGNVELRVNLTAHDEYGGWEKSVKKTFDWTYHPELTINTDGGGSTSPVEGTYKYGYGTDVTVEATLDEGWYFVEWTGDKTGTDPTITITMDEDKEITANFEEYEVLSIEKIEGDGVVEIDGTEVGPSEIPYQEKYKQGEDVDIEAIPNAGWDFSHWEGDVPDGQEENSEITITMDKEPLIDQSVTAVLGADIYDWNDLHEVRDNLGSEYNLKNDLDEDTAGYAGKVDTENGWEPIGDW